MTMWPFGGSADEDTEEECDHEFVEPDEWFGDTVAWPFEESALMDEGEHLLVCRQKRFECKKCGRGRYQAVPYKKVKLHDIEENDSI